MVDLSGTASRAAETAAMEGTDIVPVPAASDNPIGSAAVVTSNEVCDWGSYYAPKSMDPLVEKWGRANWKLDHKQSYFKLLRKRELGWRRPRIPPWDVKSWGVRQTEREYLAKRQARDRLRTKYRRNGVWWPTLKSLFVEKRIKLSADVLFGRESRRTQRRWLRSR